MDSPLSSFSSQSAFNQLKVAVIGGGIGGLSAAIALRRAGHIGSSSNPPTAADLSDHITHVVEIYERRSFDVEVGASISCAANGMSYPSPMLDAKYPMSHLIQGTQWLREWGVDIPMMKPVVLQKLVMRDWETGRVLNQYNLDNYEATWGNVYNMFHRQDMHKVLLYTATSEEGKGIPCKVVIDHM